MFLFPWEISWTSHFLPRVFLWVVIVSWPYDRICHPRLSWDNNSAATLSSGPYIFCNNIIHLSPATLKWRNSILLRDNTNNSVTIGISDLLRARDNKELYQHLHLFRHAINSISMNSYFVTTKRRRTALLRGLNIWLFTYSWNPNISLNNLISHLWHTARYFCLLRIPLRDKCGMS